MEYKRADFDIKVVGNHVEIFVRRKYIKTPITKMTNYNLTVINRVPILAFYFEDPEENFFVYFNFVSILRSTITEVSAKPFKCRLIFFTVDNKLGLRIPFELSMHDSNTLIECAMYQKGKEKQELEDSIDFIYDNPITDYEWIYKS